MKSGTSAGHPPRYTLNARFWQALDATPWQPSKWSFKIHILRMKQPFLYENWLWHTFRCNNDKWQAVLAFAAWGNGGCVELFSLHPGVQLHTGGEPLRYDIILDQNFPTWEYRPIEMCELFGGQLNFDCWMREAI